MKKFKTAQEPLKFGQPISDADKQILKHNMRKQQLLEAAYYFADDQFNLSTLSPEG